MPTPQRGVRNTLADGPRLELTRLITGLILVFGITARSGLNADYTLASKGTRMGTTIF